MPPRRELLPALTPLRFPAALAVVFFHVWGSQRGAGAPPLPGRLIHLWAAVSFFFVLSGFILTYNYLDDLRRPTRRAVWNFLVARWARTYPVHLLACALILPVLYPGLVHHLFGKPLRVVAAHLLLGQAFWPETAPLANSFNGPSWSLSAEWVFYLLLPLLLPALTSGTLLRRAVILLVALAPWLAAVSGLFGWQILDPLITPYRFPLVRFADFVAGVLLALFWRHRHGIGVPATRSVGWATVAEVGAFLATGLWIGWLVRTLTEYKWLMASGWAGAYVPPFLLLIWVLARGGGLVSRVLASRSLTYLGDISFAFYMFHFAVINYIDAYGPRKWLWEWGGAGGGSGY